MLIGRSGDDITLNSTQILIPPFVSRVPVLLLVTDDKKYEGDETIFISLSRPSEFSQLYHIGHQNILYLTIQDNDGKKIIFINNCLIAVDLYNENSQKKIKATITVNQMFYKLCIMKFLSVARIAMEANTSSLIEGNSMEICVKLEEPAELTNFIDLVIIDSPNTLVGE